MGTAIKNFKNRQHIKKIVSAIGDIGPFEKQEDYFQVVVEGADAPNSIQPKGRLIGQTAWQNIGSAITGNTSGTKVDCRDFDEVKFEVTTFDATVSVITFIASGFFFSLAPSELSGGSDSSETIAITSVDLTENNTGAKVPLTELVMPLEANSHYTAVFTLYTFGDGQTAWRFWPTYPTNCVMNIVGSGEWGPSGMFQGSKADTGAATLAQFVSANAGNYQLFKLTVDVMTGPDAGNLTMRVAPVTGTFGKILKGSHVRMKKLA